MEKCSSCGYWERNGIDGICFCIPPSPTIVYATKKEGSDEIETAPHVVMRPRTFPDDLACMYWVPIKKD